MIWFSTFGQWVGFSELLYTLFNTLFIKLVKNYANDRKLIEINSWTQEKPRFFGAKCLSKCSLFQKTNRKKWNKKKMLFLKLIRNEGNRVLVSCVVENVYSINRQILSANEFVILCICVNVLPIKIYSFSMFLSNQ